MNRPRYIRFVMVALIPAAISSGIGGALAQSPTQPAAPAASTPAPVPSATPEPAPSETPAPAASPSAAPSPPPAAAQTPATPPAAAPVQTADPFGDQITLEAKKVVIVRGTAN